MDKSIHGESSAVGHLWLSGAHPEIFGPSNLCLEIAKGYTDIPPCFIACCFTSFFFFYKLEVCDNPCFKLQASLLVQFFQHCLLTGDL